MKYGRRQGGYTLLEVVVAFAILALSLGALYESFTMTLRRSEKAGNASRAVLVAASLRDRLGPEIPLTPGRNEGTEGNCRWQESAQALEHDGARQPADVAAEKVAVDVSCGEAGTLGTAHFDTIELVPRP